MGAWGAGVTQSDEYCEVYDLFMEKYDAGESVETITDEILNSYLSQFDADDGVLHDVYFALAKCQWMCGALSDVIMSTVKDIIQNGKNLKFFKELDADDRLLRDRKKNLDKLHDYITHGIVPMRNLILTFETLEYPLTLELIDWLVRSIIL